MHSPAPWSEQGTTIIDASGDAVADLLPPPNDGARFDANRCLIVAAPLMLEALKDALNSLGVIPLATLRNLIDKAEGR